MVVTSASVVVAVLARPPAARADLIFEPTRTWNGHRIYLSPARHEPDNRGCSSASENELAYFAAYDAANSLFYNDVYDPSNPYRSLRSRGYRVRVGTGTLSSAIANSNAWGATRHIVIHSNADGPPTQCSRTNRDLFGTLGIYRSGSTQGYDLTYKLSHSIGVETGRRSPGTNDIMCFNPGHPCTDTDLGELRETNAPAAYMETEYHTWNPGVTWLYDSASWAWRFGYAVDWHLGYPR